MVRKVVDSCMKFIEVIIIIIIMSVVMALTVVCPSFVCLSFRYL